MKRNYYDDDYDNEKSHSTYVNHCWYCKEKISSDSDKRCPNCRLFICSSCGRCFCDKKEQYNNDYDDNY